MRNKLKRRFDEQGGKCYWCGRKTLMRWPGKSNREMAKCFGIEVGSKNWRKEVRKREATAEHLIPKSLGGTDAWENIVMACKGRNTERGNNLAFKATALQSPTRSHDSRC